MLHSSSIALQHRMYQSLPDSILNDGIYWGTEMASSVYSLTQETVENTRDF